MEYKDTKKPDLKDKVALGDLTHIVQLLRVGRLTKTYNAPYTTKLDAVHLNQVTEVLKLTENHWVALVETVLRYRPQIQIS